MQEVDTFEEIVNQKEIMKLDYDKNKIYNYINIMDYLPKASQVSKMIYKMRSGLNNRVKDIHGSIS